MTSWGASVRALVVGAALLAACSNDGDPDAAPTTTGERAATTTTTAPERPTSTTTTAFDPASVEGQVEAAYLRSWDVYAEAVYNLELDEAALADVYAERSLESKRAEIAERIASGRAALVDVEHRYEVLMVDAETAHVLDRFVNHQVLIDPETKEPTEPDPNEELLFNFQLKQIADEWRVTLIERVNP